MTYTLGPKEQRIIKITVRCTAVIERFSLPTSKSTRIHPQQCTSTYRMKNKGNIQSAPFGFGLELEQRFDVINERTASVFLGD
jgi:hypothetical protein